MGTMTGVRDDPHSSPGPGPEAATGSLPGAGPPRSPAQRGRIPTEQGRAIAQMYVAGAPLTMIAAVFGRTPHGIQAALDGHLAPVVEEVRGRVMREVACHQFEMMAMLPLARSVVQGGLASADERTRLDTARWLIDAQVPKPITRTEQDLRISGHVNHDVSGVLEQIGSHLAALRSANTGRDLLARVKTGAEALPRLLIPAPTDDAA